MQNFHRAEAYAKQRSLASKSASVLPSDPSVLKVAELVEIATSLGLKPKSKATKINLISMIFQHEQENAPADTGKLTPKQRKRLRLKAHRQAA